MQNPPAKTILPWLRANLGKGALGCLTSHDTLALRAAVQVVELWGHAGLNQSAALAAAYRDIVLCMQPATRHLAYHATAHVLDWGHRSEVWSLANLPPLTNPGRCAFEH